MKKSILVLVGATCVLSGCATPRSRWALVDAGQTRDQVIGIMEARPDEIMKKPGTNQDVLAWGVDAFEMCAVLLDADGRVQEKRCKDNPQARAEAESSRAQAMQAYLQRQHERSMQENAQRDESQRVYMNSFRNPVSTDCTTNYYGGQAHTNCSSR